MPNFIVIVSKKETNFNHEAKTVLESHKFVEVHPGTFMGTNGALIVSTKLKNLESYKKNRSGASIKVYHGNLTA